MLVKSQKNCKSCNVVCFYYFIKTCLVYCISINTSNRIFGSPSVLEFSHMALSLKTLPIPVIEVCRCRRLARLELCEIAQWATENYAGRGLDNPKVVCTIEANIRF